MQKNYEIGSEFWSVPLSQKQNNFFSDDISWFLSGRVALKAIIKDIKKTKSIHTAALPSWCCDSMIKPFLDEGIEVIFYSVYVEDDELVQEFENIKNADVLFVMDYFGFSRWSNRDFDGITICDITHSVFSGSQQNADYYFGSLRKWAGFYTGGFAYKTNGKLSIESELCSENYVKLREDAMKFKSKYISGEVPSKEYFEFFYRAEEILETCGMSAASKRDIYCARNLDIEFIRMRRRENSQFLLDNFKRIALFNKITDNDCPLFFPIIVESSQRDKLKNYLIDKQIYCPVHWPVSKLHKLNSKTGRLYEQEISIICDQRYTTLDMEYICTQIKNFLGCDN